MRNILGGLTVLPAELPGNQASITLTSRAPHLQPPASESRGDGGPVEKEQAQRDGHSAAYGWAISF
jgi:hypothetical protein